MLERREHSASELLQKLSIGDHDKTIVLDVLRQLAKENLQSDRRFIEAYIHSQIQRGYGSLRIKQGLHQRHISGDLIESYLDTNDPKWQERVVAVREKKFGQQVPVNHKEIARQLRFLQQRGFTVDQIRQILKAEGI